MDLPIFKIHASQIGKIMAGALSKPTTKQLQQLSELEAKKAAKGITEKQQEVLSELIAKRDAPPALQDGAKTFCREWMKEQGALYNRRKHFSNKYTTKGNECEKDAIALTARIMGYGEIIKNDLFHENDWIVGTCDMLLKSIVEDTKCSYDQTTFPLFATVIPDDDYWWQGLGYADMLDKPRFAVNYCLMDTPDTIVDKSAYYRSKDMGMDEVPMELWDNVKAEMTFSNLPDWLRFKRFEFERDDVAIAAIHRQVELCRVYIAEQWQYIISLQRQPYFITIHDNINGAHVEVRDIV